MTRVIEFLISLAIVAALFLVFGIFLPSHRHLVEKVETNRKQTIVFDTINSLRRFPEWNALTMHDPRVKIKLSGPDSGVGARLDYSSDDERIGDGSWEITASDPKNSVTYAINNEARGSNKVSTFLLTPTGRGAIKRNIEIQQTYDVDYGWDLLGRYAGLYVSSQVGDDMKLGLSRLSNMLAAVPNIDYLQKGSPLVNLHVEQRPAENLLFVPSTVERNNEKIKTAMSNNMQWIKKVMDANGLEAAGPFRIVTTEFGRENYAFDIAQPVRKKGTGPAADETAATDEDAGDAEAGTDAAATPAPAAAPAMPDVDAEPITVKLEGPVKYEHTKPSRVATASYTGYMAELATARDAVRAWALTNGYVPAGRPYEAYKSGIEKSFTVDGQYDVFWPVK